MTVPGRSWRDQLRGVASAVTGKTAEVAGWVTGRSLMATRALPGIAGAAAVSVGTGELASHVFGHGLAPWVALLAAGVFALALDKRIP